MFTEIVGKNTIDKKCKVVKLCHFKMVYKL